MAATVLAGRGAAQDAVKPENPPAAANPKAATEVSLEPPDAAASMNAYRLVEGWVRAWKVPEKDGGAGAFSGVSVTLRLDGAIVGRGVDTTEGGAILARAAASALREADVRLPIPWDAQREQRRAELAKQLEIGLELAGPFVPFRAETYDDVDQGLSPGLWGVAARAGESFAAVFPEEMLMAGFAPSAALRSAISTATANPQLATPSPSGQPGAIARDRGLAFYRFRVTHLAPARAGEGPMFLHRGGLIVPASAISTAAIAEMGEGFAAHLRRRCFENAAGWAIRATERPTSKFSPGEVANGFDTALVAYALARHARASPDPVAAGESRTLAVGLLDNLIISDKDESGDAIVEAAMYVVALREVERIAQGPRPKVTGAVREAARTQIFRAYDGARGWSKDVPEGARGLVALARVIDAKARGGDASEVAPALRAIYRDAGSAGILGQWPWLGWAEQELAGPGAPIPATTALRDALERLFQQQVTPEQAGPDDADLVGGFVFASGGTLLPTWHSLRPLAFGATMLRDERLIDPKDRVRELRRFIAAMRFVRQLALDPAAGHLCPQRERAMGGVRASVWDYRQPAAATAMGLLVTCEMGESLEAMRGK